MYPICVHYKLYLNWRTLETYASPQLNAAWVGSDFVSRGHE